MKECSGVELEVARRGESAAGDREFVVEVVRTTVDWEQTVDVDLTLYCWDVVSQCIVLVF